MLIDSHCHLAHKLFASQHETIVQRAKRAGVEAMVVPATRASEFAAVLELSSRFSSCFAALGLHPYFEHSPQDIEILQQVIERSKHDPKLLALGEMGLDFKAKSLASQQEFYFLAQLEIAQVFDFPVILHLNHCVERGIVLLKNKRVRGGIVHAFNGSFEQAKQLISLGFALGFGGVLSREHAPKIHDLAVKLPLSSIVLETDSPDMRPSWARDVPNEPKNVARFAEILANLRGESLVQVIEETGKTARRVLNWR